MNRFKFKARYILWAALAISAAGVFSWLSGGGFRAQASAEARQVTYSHTPELPYYDIRLDKNDTAQATLTALRVQSGVPQHALAAPLLRPAELAAHRTPLRPRSSRA